MGRKESCLTPGTVSRRFSRLRRGGKPDIRRGMESREALVALNLIEGVGPIRVRQLIEHFGDASAILGASKYQLLQARNIGEETAEAIVN
jgi:excinuclease UvrABC nuclease subunit